MLLISILNFKGGVGKTSVTVNLGHALSQEGKRVLLVDCDRQRNTSSTLPRDGEYPYTLREVLMGQVKLSDAIYQARPNLFVMPAHPDLEQAAKHITVSGPRTLNLLKREMKEHNGFDFVFYDHAPSYSPLTDAILLASEYMLIPVQLEPYAVRGLLDMITKLTATLNELEHEVGIIGIVPNNLNYSKTMTQAYLSSLKQSFDGRVTVPIRTDAEISKAQSQDKTIFEYNIHSKGAHDFTELATDVLIRTEGVMV